MVICSSERGGFHFLSVGSFASCFPVTVKKRRKNLSHLLICPVELVETALNEFTKNNVSKLQLA